MGQRARQTVAIATVALGAAWVPAVAGAATSHVRAAAPAGGDGSAARPFATLAAIEAASAPGDTLIVDPAPASAPALDGGIALKLHQTLMGGGPAVTSAAAGAALPVLTNSSTARLDGDAVRLANGATVRNLVIRGTARGGVYGLDTVGVTIMGLDVFGHNTSCTKGFLVQPFVAPTGVPLVGGGVPGVKVIAPQNGWAGIMVDGDRAVGPITISDNVVHDADCGDGIDIRAAGTSDMTATINRNTVRKLKEGANLDPAFGSVLAIGMQARDSARLEVTQADNTQTDIGSEGADCEGQFANTSEAGVVIDHVTRNTFRNGIGGSSCNGFESIVSNGSGTLETELSYSTFENNVGDMFEEGNLGAGSTMRWDMQHVVARHTTERGDNATLASDPGAGAIPFNLGDCIVLGQTGTGSLTVFRMADTVLEDCNNGVNALSGGELQNGVGPTEGLVVAIDHSRIASMAKYGIQEASLAASRLLSLKLSHTEITGSGSYGVGLDVAASGSVDRADLDLGGGVLGSDGGNCLTGNAKPDLEVTRLASVAKGNWWGQAGGPTPTQVQLTQGGSADTSQSLKARPDCGPRPPAATAAPAAPGVTDSQQPRTTTGRVTLHVHVSPGRDRAGPVRLKTTGRVLPPSGTSDAACAHGRVSVQVQVDSRTISTRQARLSSACRFSSRVVLGQRRRFGRAKTLKVTVRFGGTAILARRTAVPQKVRLR